MSLLKNLFGNESARAVTAVQSTVDAINACESNVQNLSDDALKAKTAFFKEELADGSTLEDILPEAFAVVREAARRTLGQRHYDVQLVGGIVLHRGDIAEMKTGEGKTLVATLPVYLNALAGRGVHVVTVNDYLSRRDAVWMGQIYAFLGLSVGVINSQNQSFFYDPGHTETDQERDATGSFRVIYEFLRPVGKREAYRADITYGTNSEFGFDYLRDNIAYREEDISQRMEDEGGFHYAIVDEIDSILIDEARTPLIISMPAEESEDLYQTFARITAQLTEGEDYEVEEKHKATALTDAGIEKAEKLLGIDNIYTDAGIKYVHHLETAVRAKANYKRDKDYVVRDGKVIIVDSFTGRLQPGRRWSEGLHQAIEAKENVPIERESRTFASITYQNYFRQYKKLSGMTGTAETSAEEFYKVYGLETVVIPTNVPVARIDRNDLIFRTTDGKFKAIASKVKELNEKGQPVLIGTVAIEDNELLSAYLQQEGIIHEILNAKNHEREGEIIAQAGRRDAVTIATNMAGRGVDIKLGGNPPSPGEYEAVKETGGLFVLGTERHEARRIDNQLRGRSGRQGDPGETQFFVSLDDTLMRVFAADTIKNMMAKMDIPEDMPIENRLITRSLETAQKKIEGLNFDARKHVLEFDDVLNTQRQSIYNRRRQVLLGKSDDVLAALDEVVGDDEEVKTVVDEKRSALGEEEFVAGVRRLLLQTIDLYWVGHLEQMDYLRGSVNLRAYGQRDPLVEYKREGLRLFREMETSVAGHIRELLPNMGVGAFAKEQERLRRQSEQAKTRGGGASTKGVTVVARKADKIGRNDVVTITNGNENKEMKYKKAEPLIQSGEWKLITEVEKK
ncbi:preprotein translocase subunit SecA [Candidatus Wolfebacteria bacterium]|nr:preprotein translocase subunit SecA [Candidatus Wolfebacteria bacterium]